jgi:hypothetical protein
MKRMLFVVIFLIFAATPVAAQTIIPPNRISLLVIAATGDAMSVTATPTLAASTISVPSTGTGPCNLTPVNPLPGVVANPTVTRLDDPFNVGKQCEVLVPQSLTAGGLIPNGSYRFSAVASADACVVTPGTAPVPCDGPRTATPVPFSVALTAKPGAPTGLGVIK